MKTYFLRRFLLMWPTLFCITAVCFCVTRYVPGGPVEQAILKYKAAMMGGGAGGEVTSGGSGQEAAAISPEMVQKLKEIYGFDKPVWKAYLIWLSKLVRLDMGVSYTYDVPVWDVIWSRFHVSIIFGLTGFLLTYMVCIPLGVVKAVNHNTKLDLGSSVLVFIGYSIPGFALGIVLLVLFGGGSYFDIFPLGGIYSNNYNNMNLFGKLIDRIHHMVLPIICYMVASFASLTILMKNSMMENLGQDYVRTAFAKGLPERTVILGHALRNSLIPLAVGLGHALSLILAGSFLIEKVFDIHGMGLLGYESLIQRDYPVSLGIFVIASILALLGNIISDFLYTLIDPRISFS
ncbi:ABC transporter permease subunit [Candidatus Riflebacteria bacterium]